MLLPLAKMLPAAHCLGLVPRLLIVVLHLLLVLMMMLMLELMMWGQGRDHL
jgi:hypothetical protein